MLTADLVQARVYRKQVRPRYIDTSDEGNLALAGELIDVFSAHEGRPRHELDRELKEILGTGTEFLLHRGAGQVVARSLDLRHRGGFRAGGAAPRGVCRCRRRLSGSPAVEMPRVRLSADRGLLDDVAGRLEVETRQIERGLYADLKDEQILTEWKQCRPGMVARALQRGARPGGAVQGHGARDPDRRRRHPPTPGVVSQDQVLSAHASGSRATPRRVPPEGDRRATT